MEREQLERYIVSTLLFDSKYIRTMVDSGLCGDHFKCEPYRTIFRCFFAIWVDKGDKIAEYTRALIAYMHMTDSGLFERLGGEPMLVGLQDEIPDQNTTKHLKYAIKLLKRMK